MERDDIANIRYGFCTRLNSGVGSNEVIKTLIRAIVDRKFPTENFTLCRAINISIERLLKWAIWTGLCPCAEMGLNPIRLSRWHPLTLPDITTWMTRLVPYSRPFCRYRADRQLIQNQSPVRIQDGELIAKDKKLLKNADNDYSCMVTKGVAGLDDLKAPQPT